jgi:hypothetical protein
MNDERRRNMVKTHFFMIRRVMAMVGAVAAISLAASSVWAADFPQKGKAVQMLIGFAAGGSSDVGARKELLPLAQEQSDVGPIRPWGRPIGRGFDVRPDGKADGTSGECLPLDSFMAERTGGGGFLN